MQLQYTKNLDENISNIAQQQQQQQQTEKKDSNKENVLWLNLKLHNSHNFRSNTYNIVLYNLYSIESEQRAICFIQNGGNSKLKRFHSK